MKKRLLIFWIMVISAGLLSINLSTGQSAGVKSSGNDTSFEAFLVKWENAHNAFINGDPLPWKNICSQTADASIMGGFGGYEKGWEIVGPRYDWAASQFKKSGAKLSFEYINKIVSGNLAYIILIEKFNPVAGNHTQPGHYVLRSTQIFRKENGDWKLLHRHADWLTEKKVPQ